MHMQETLHKHSTKLDESCDPSDVLGVSSIESVGSEDVVEAEDRKKTHKANLLKNWPLMSTIIVYCIFSLQEIAYTEVS